MRIALVAPLVAPIRDPQLGGAQAIVADLALGLSTRGHEVDVYAAEGSRVAGANVVHTGIDAAALVATRFHSGAPSAPAGGERAAFRRVFGLVRRGNHDVVHNHAFDPAAIDAARGVPATVVHTLHLPVDRRMAASLHAARSAGPAPIVVAVSAAQAAGWRATIRIDSVIPNGVPTRLIPWSARGDGEGIVFAGRLSPEKGAREAIAIARAAGLGIDLYGDVYDAAYTAAIEPCCHGPGVHLHRPLPRTRLWDRLRRARAVLCPAQWEEPFGLVAAEAQAAGTPVVGFRRGGLPEVVDDGVTGRLVPPGDVPAAAAALRDAGGISRAACRRHAEARLDLETMIDAHERLYRGGRPLAADQAATSLRMKRMPPTTRNSAT